MSSWCQFKDLPGVYCPVFGGDGRYCVVNLSRKRVHYLWETYFYLIKRLKSCLLNWSLNCVMSNAAPVVELMFLISLCKELISFLVILIAFCSICVIWTNEVISFPAINLVQWSSVYKLYKFTSFHMIFRVS